MESISFSQNGFTPFQKLLGHNKEILEKWSSLEDSLFSSQTFSPELKEEIRRILAVHNGCEYCKAKGAPSEKITDIRMQSAAYAADVYGRRAHMNEEDFSILKKVFADNEISELLALICFITACQRFGALLNLEPSCQI